MKNKYYFINSSLFGLLLFLVCILVSSGCTSGSTVTDIDGNEYPTVKIGDQWWTAENLKVTHYKNGEPIPHVTDGEKWSNLTTGAYSAYANDPDNIPVYGLLYNWYAIDDSRELAPEGWHIPTDSEWQQLEIALGMPPEDADDTDTRGTNEGSKLAGISSLWNNGYIRNDAEFGSSGFDAIPGGLRETGAQFRFIAFRAHYWALTDLGSVTAWLRALDCYETDIDRVQYNKRYGLSVRCIKD